MPGSWRGRTASIEQDFEIVQPGYETADFYYQWLPRKYQFGPLLNRVEYDTGSWREDVHFGTLPAKNGLPQRNAKFNTRHPGAYILLKHLWKFLESEIERVFSQKISFTQGIIARNAACCYHKDAAIAPGQFEAICHFREDALDGELIFPEQGLIFADPKPTYLLYKGGDHFHGAKSTRLESNDGYRISVLFYNHRKVKIDE